MPNHLSNHENTLIPILHCVLKSSVVEEEVHSVEDALEWLECGNARVTSATEMNIHSSRSHVMFTVCMCVCVCVCTVYCGFSYQFQISVFFSFFLQSQFISIVVSWHWVMSLVHCLTIRESQPTSPTI